jgi:hypothetical protein
MSSNLNYTWAAVIPHDRYKMGLRRWVGEVIDYQNLWVVLRREDGQTHPVNWTDHKIYLYKTRGEADDALRKP